jgi:uncharacterized lipoprotein YbaY
MKQMNALLRPFASAALALMMAWSAAGVSHAVPYAQTADLTEEALANAAYPIEGAPDSGIVQLTDGKYVNEAARYAATLVGPQARGDLNGDGAADAAVTLVVDSGGSGSFTYVAAVLNDGGKAKPVDSVLIGDRIRMQRLTIDNGTITVRYLDRRFDQPMSARPTIPVVQRYALTNDTLVATDPISAASLRHTSYLVPEAPDGQVFLVGGRYSDSTAGLTANLLARPRANGDLNGDGSPDAAVILNVQTGQDTTLSYLEAVLNDDYQPRTAAAELLGSGVRPTSVSIADGKVTVQYLARAEGVPATARPTVETTKIFVLQGNDLVEETPAGQPAPASTAQLSGVLTGTAAYMQRIALPPDAVLVVELHSIAEAPSAAIATQTIETQGQQVPIPFELKYDPAGINPRSIYYLRTRITQGGEPIWVNARNDLVLTRGYPATDVEVLLQQVSAPVAPAAAPAAAAPAEGAMIQTSFACADGKTLDVTFDNANQTAIVTFEGQSRTLKQEVSGSGIRYADDTWVLIGKGNEAMLQDAKTEATLAGQCFVKGAQPGPSLELTGTYVSDVLPAADASGRVITLTLASVGSADMTTQFIGKGDPIVEHGSWAQVGGNAIVTLTNTGGTTETLAFQPQGDNLVLLNPVATGYGTAGLTLKRVSAGEAAAAAPAETAPAETPPVLSGVLTGTVTYLQRIALPPNAIVEVQLADVSLADAAATVIVSQTIETKGMQVPIPYELNYDPAQIDPRMTYAVSARITVDDKLAWISDTRHDALTRGAPLTGIEVMVVPVQ